MNFDFDRHIDRRGTGSDKWDKYAGKDILPMWVADMDFASPPAVLDALTKRVAHGVFGYATPTNSLIETVQEVLYKRYGWQVDAKWLVWLPGLVTGINVTCRAIGQKDTAVMTTVPVYPPFLTAPGYSDRRCIQVPLALEDNRWVMDFDALEAQVTADTELFILCNPHNPTGRVYTRAELGQLADFCLRHEIVLCSDEIHCDLILDPDKTHIPTALLDPDIAARTITLMAPSKTYNIAGLGCSFAVISNAALRKRFIAAASGIVPHVNALALVAAEAAYRHGDQWLSEALTYLRANRDQVDAAISEMPGLRTTAVEATYLTWIDTSDSGIDNPAQFFESAGVGLSDGRDFAGQGYLRLNFGCTRSTLSTALDRMAAALR